MKKTVLSLLCTGAALMLQSFGNPYLPLWEHLPDGEPRVFEDPDRPGKYRAYIIGSHDTSVDRYCGSDIRMWSAPVEDLTDWRDEGAIFTYSHNGKWDIMYAPDLVEVPQKDGSKIYYLYPHSRGPRREAMVCKGTRPDGPFTPVNLSEDGSHTVAGSVLGFDPSIYVDIITDPSDPDYGTGFRAYGFWGFQRSLAAELDPATMYSVRPGTETMPYFIPACTPDGKVRDPEGTQYPALYKEQDPKDFGFFEASSIRKVGNKYVMIFSGYSGREYGLGNTNSTLRYAFGDTPLGPWRSGGVLVDSRGIVPNADGTHLACTNAAHNTHGSLQDINGQWYVFYHRPPRGFGFARQAMVAPVTIQWDETPVAQGGKVVIRGYDPYAPDGIWTARTSDGNEYTGAEVTSEGFQIYGLDPFRYYSAGYACYLSDIGAQQDSWDIWDNDMPVRMKGNDIVGFKYFGFGGLDKGTKGVPAFQGTKKGDKTHINIFLTPITDQSFKVAVMLDGPYDNSTWKGKKIGEITVPESGKRAKGEEVIRLTADVSVAVDGLKGKHAIYLVAEGENGKPLCMLKGLGFSKRGKHLECPKVPEVTISVNGNRVELPATPTRMTAENGYTGYDRYDVDYKLEGNRNPTPKVTASSDDRKVKINISQPVGGKATVTFDNRGVKKIYTINII